MRKYEGIYVPLVTPFVDGKVDWEALGRIIDWYLTTGVSGIVACGTTGEASTLDFQEHIDVVRFSADRVCGKMQVLAGTGSNNTKEAVNLTQASESAGANAALVVSPYYNKPNEEGIFQYYKTIAENSNIDVLLYNIPGRTGSNIKPELIKRISDIKNVRGIKEGAGDIHQLTDLISRYRGTDFSVLSGDDSLLFECCTAGGRGAIMAVAGVVPSMAVNLHRAIVNEELSAARDINFELREIVKLLYCETNPIAVKYAICSILGIQYELRSPLTPLSASNQSTIDSWLEKHHEEIGLDNLPMQHHG